MKLIINVLLVLFIGIAALAIAKVSASADTGGYFYGGGVPSAEIMVDKQVKVSDKGEYFVDNLGPTDYKYMMGQYIDFKVIVKNVGDRDLTDVQLRDIFPSDVDFVNGPYNHIWHADIHEMTSSLGTLKAGESIEFITTGRVKSKADLPADKSLVCVTNWVEAKSGDQVDSDSAGLCIQNLEFLPATGPSVLPIVLMVGLGASGLVLIRKSKVNG